jgi:hypothetical protein
MIFGYIGLIFIHNTYLNLAIQIRRAMTICHAKRTQKRPETAISDDRDCPGRHSVLKTLPVRGTTEIEKGTQDDEEKCPT